MRLLVTGASGFIGRNLLLAVPHDWEVVATFRETDLVPFCREHGLVHVRPVRADLGGERLDRVLPESFDGCVFLAANGDPARSVPQPLLDLRSNAASLVALLEHVTCGRLVFLSSGAVYHGLRGPVSPASPVSPRLPYAISKLAAERYLEHFVETGRVRAGVSVRFFGAYGPHEPPRKIYSRLVRRFAIERRPDFTVTGDGRNLIDAMYVDDAVRGILAILADPVADPGAGTLDLGSGAPLSITDLVQAAAAAFGLEADVRYEGSVPEYIEFRSVDRTMQDRYAFRPAVGLAEGLQRLAAHLGARGAAGR